MLVTGVIAGVVSFILAHAIKWVLDKGSDRTNGFFGYCMPPEAPVGHGDDKDDFSVGGKHPPEQNYDSAAPHEVRALTPVLLNSNYRWSIIDKMYCAD